MSEQKKHEMTFERKHLSGAEEWVCPICDRRMLIHWEPKFRRTVLESGDPNVIHSGFRIQIPVVGNLIFPFVEEPPSYEYAENAVPEIDEFGLVPWATWMDENRFEDLWKNDPT